MTDEKFEEFKVFLAKSNMTPLEVEHEIRRLLEVARWEALLKNGDVATWLGIDIEDILPVIAYLSREMKKLDTEVADLREAVGELTKMVERLLTHLGVKTP